MKIETIKALIANLNTVFADMDAAHEINAKEWARGRCEALATYKKSDDYKEISKKGAWGGMYDKLFAIAGGKTWYKLFCYGYGPSVEDFMVKNCKAIIEKRNALIAKKLEKAGVNEVLESNYERSAEGFDGIFRVMTDDGEKVVIINTIYAGGYNIQCLHTRTLVKVK